MQQLISLHVSTGFEKKMNSFIFLRLVQLIVIHEHKYNKNAIKTHDKKYVSSVKKFLLTNNLPLQLKLSCIESSARLVCIKVNRSLALRAKVGQL